MTSLASLLFSSSHPSELAASPPAGSGCENFSFERPAPRSDDKETDLCQGMTAGACT